jgi:prevent-host-death family protein
MERASGSASEPLKGPVTVSELRANLAEMIDRAESGEEVIIARGREPVAKLVPLAPRVPRRLGTLKALLSAGEIEALEEAIDAPLRRGEQRVIEGEGTDELGIWRGLPGKPRES